MTLGASITVEAKGGGQSQSELVKVADGAYRIAAAERAAEHAAIARGHAQRNANQHNPGGGGGGGHPGGAGSHGGFGGFIHSMGSLRMGETSHLSHSASRIMSMGAAGGVAAAAALVGNAIVSGIEALQERMAEVVKKAAEIEGQMRAARRSMGEGALAFAGSNGLAIDRLHTGGASDADILDAQRRGLGPNGLAAVWGTRNRAGSIQAALMARRFGMDPNSAAEQIGAAGGIPMGADPTRAAAGFASMSQGRVIGAIEIARAGGPRTGMAQQLDYIQALESRGAVGQLNQLAGGRAGAAAADKLNKTLNADAYALTEAYKEATEKSEVLREIADNTSTMIALWQNVTNPVNSNEQKARTSLIDSGAALDRITVGGAAGPGDQ